MWGILYLPSDTDAGGVKGGEVEPVQVGAVGPEKAEDRTAEATSVATASLIIARMSSIERAAGVGGEGMVLGPDSERVPTSAEDEKLDLSNIGL